MLKTYGCSAEQLKTYAFRVDFDHRGCAIVDPAIYSEDQSEVVNTVEASEEIHRLAQQRQLDHPTANIPYATAVNDVLAARPDLAAQYATELKTHRPQHRKRITQPPFDERLKLHSDPSIRVHKKALEIEDHEGISYPEAVNLACQRDPALAAEYAGWSSNGG